MTQKKQNQNQIRAIPTRDLPERDRSSFTVPEQLRRLHPNVKPEHFDLALKRSKHQITPVSSKNHIHGTIFTYLQTLSCSN